MCRPGKVDTTYNKDLSDQNYRLYFPLSNVQAATNNGWSSWYPGAGAGGSTVEPNLTDSVAKYSSHCSSYIDAWRATLMDCPALAQKDETTREKILVSITGKMVDICNYGTNASNMYGASTVPPNITWANYNSFEDAINYVLDSAGIPRDMRCNPYVIESPKPYGKNQTVTKQYMSSIDDCNCSQWALISAKINAAGYNSNSYTSANQYLRTRYQDTLTLAVFNGLQNCGTTFKYYCRTVTETYMDHNNQQQQITYQKCEEMSQLPLSSPQPLPSFLTCGFDSSNLKCYSCSDFINFENAFYGLFGQHPVFSGNISDTAMMWNDLFAKYVNFKTGLNKSWTYYAARFNSSSCGVGGIAGSGVGLSICPENKPLNDTSGFVKYAPTPCQAAYIRATDKATLLYNYNQQQLLDDFTAAYNNAWIGTTEAFNVADTIKEYHYTLYYYDQAGNLVKTVAPKGVRPDYSSIFLNTVKVERNKMVSGQSWTPNVPLHSLVTKYCYNGLNQVVVQKSPDAGVSNFWYDRLGRLAVSQNAKQRTSSDYSYTYYDELGRIKEVGQLNSGTAITTITAKNESNLINWFNNATGSRVQITQTKYDLEYGPINGVKLGQRNLRNRVSYTQVVNSAADTYPASATYYTYDIHGNVDTLLQDFGNSDGIANAMNQSANRFKRIVYNYDLISGKVNQVSYQPGAWDAYYHRYAYDAENRLTDVYTGRDSVMLDFFPEREAHYNYYKHGPLAQTILGQLQVQKQDYAYTLQGWLKGINPTMGGTLTNGTDTAEAFPIAQDAYGFSLHYFKNDYRAIGYDAQSTSVLGALGSDAAPLFNGNIAAMSVNIPKLGNAKVYNYHYDQLNRIVAMDMFNGLNVNNGSFAPISVNDYRERVSYDANGNILTYDRHGDAARISMDSLQYFYTTNTNRLHKVTDNAVDAAAGDYSKYNDIKQGQADDNYQYDEIGNLVGDNVEGITDVTWNVYGKIASLKKSGSLIKYVYDASGNRVMKQTANDTTIYLRDASANVMSIYSKPALGILTQSEMYLYGIGRIGMATIHGAPDTAQVMTGSFADGTKRIVIRGEKLFELSNHLGNVLATTSDKKIAVSGGGTNIDYYTADVNSTNDYFPGGMQMPDRKFNFDMYRYGFNGKEKDDKMGVVQYDYGFRIYDPRLVRFKSVDPLMKSFPQLTPYQFASNSPIANVDLDGRESEYYTTTVTYTRMFRRNSNGDDVLQNTFTESSTKHESAGWFSQGSLYSSNGALGSGTLYTVQTQTIDVYDAGMGGVSFEQTKPRVVEKIYKLSASDEKQMNQTIDRPQYKGKFQIMIIGSGNGLYPSDQSGSKANPNAKTIVVDMNMWNEVFEPILLASDPKSPTEIKPPSLKELIDHAQEYSLEKALKQQSESWDATQSRRVYQCDNCGQFKNKDGKIIDTSKQHTNRKDIQLKPADKFHNQNE
ncbi:MAG: RHS repeat-associated core domain-containing protein [Agriterribacter sp.]